MANRPIVRVRRQNSSPRFYKVVSVVTQTTLGGLPTGCKFPVVYMCQKLWKLAGSRQSYCKNYLAYFFGPPCMCMHLIFPEARLIGLHFCRW